MIINNMQKLPILRKAKEAKSGVDFRQWFNKNKHLFYSCTFELKQTETDSFRVSNVKRAQVDMAKNVASDEGVLLRMDAMHKGQADYGFYRRAMAYFVIKYKSGSVIINHIMWKWVIEHKKTLTYFEALEICDFDF